ncbi:hypothetical protein [Rahnella aceris]|jgi:hypothetical protein|uniref:Uncharacterized protein n=1 Tax=Rahnella sp. (strain Y9602) TaxID=2703885 RepID=A0ABW6CAL9_RAHSY|nr:hypothetical protein [uncultured Rahnella sp.]
MSLFNNGDAYMDKHFFVCIFVLVAFSVGAADGGAGGKGADGGNGGSMSQPGKPGADGGRGSDGGSSDNSPGRAGCPGGTDPAENGTFYLPGTKEQCNPGPQDSTKSANFL